MVHTIRARLLCAAFAAFALPATGCLKVPEDNVDAPTVAPAAPTTAAEVLTRHVDALGGDEAVRAIGQRTIEARVVFYPEDNCPAEDPSCITEEKTGSFLFQNTANGRLYRRTVIGESIEERGFDGTKGWVMAGQALRIDTDEEAKVSREDAQLHWYFGADARNVEATLLPPRREDSEGQPRTLDGIQWVVEGQEPGKQLWFDRETGLLREEVSEDGEGDQRVGQVVVYDDYKLVDEVKVPHLIKVTSSFGDREQRVDFITQRVTHEAIDKAKFAVPELPKPEKKPDALLAGLAQAVSQADEDPKNKDNQIEVARLSFMAAHFDDAEKAAKKVLALDAKEPEALWILARVQVMRGDYGSAKKTIGKAKSAGVRDEVIAREQGWIHLRKREFSKLAKDLDTAGNATLAGRYRSFAGKPLEFSIEGGGCAAEVPLVTAAPLLTLDVTVGGKTVGAIFDTGAADLILTESLAAELNVSAQARTQIAEGLPEVGHGQVGSVKLGSLEFKNVPLNIFDDASIADMAGDQAERVQAVVGVGMLTDFVVDIDGPGSKFKLVDDRSKKCKKEAQALRTGPSTRFWLHESHYLYLMGTMNGAEGLYLLNTGMRGADMTATPFAYAHAGIGAPVLKADQATMVRVEKLELGDALVATDLASAWGYFQQSQTSDGFRLDGMLGVGALGGRRFIVDFETYQIYFP